MLGPMKAADYAPDWAASQAHGDRSGQGEENPIDCEKLIQ
jgi:hypothetical protein